MVRLQQAVESTQALSPCEVVVVFEAGDDDLAPDQLEEGIEEGEYEEQDFEEFCRNQGLPADPASARSATAYLRSIESFGLIMFKLPSARPAVEAAFAALVSIARGNGIVLRDPQVGVAGPPAVPLMWE